MTAVPTEAVLPAERRSLGRRLRDLSIGAKLSGMVVMFLLSVMGAVIIVALSFSSVLSPRAAIDTRASTRASNSTTSPRPPASTTPASDSTRQPPRDTVGWASRRAGPSAELARPAPSQPAERSRERRES